MNVKLCLHSTSNPFLFFLFFQNSKENLVFQDMFPVNVSCLEVVVWDEGAEVAILP